jgi:NADH-quinone oxidoreductase subunit N
LDFLLSLTHFSPEIVLTVGALVVLGWDLVVHGRDRGQALIAGVTLVVATAATLVLYGQPAYDVFRVSADGEVLRAGAFLSDGFTHFFRLMSLLASLLVLMSAVTFMRSRTAQKGEFYALLLFATLGMTLMAGANDLIMIALAIELLSISSYLLTAHLRDDPLSGEAGLKYFLYGSIASATMLFGLSLMYGATASTSLPVIAAVAMNPEAVFVHRVGELMLPAFMLVFVGIGFKIAVVPFHQWSPDAYQGAPTPITSFLSIGPKAAGFALLIRVLMTVYGSHVFMNQWIGTLTAISIITMVLGNIVALSQTDVKRMMAYSSIAQAGYMMIGVVSVAGAVEGRVEALGSVLIYVLAYVFTNAGAFAVIIAVHHATGSSDISAFDGLARRAPILAVAMFLFFLSLVGIPPLAGFIGKFAVFRSALLSGQYVLAVTGVLTGVISVGYYFRIVKAMFFNDSTDSAAIRPSASLAFVTVAALAMTFIIGLYAAPFVEISNAAVAALPGVASLAGVAPH